MMKTSAKLYTVKMVWLSLVALGITSAYAAVKDESRNPIGCIDTGYEFDMETLHLLPHDAGANQSLYFLYNPLGKKVTLYQMRDDESSRTMYLNHAINAGQWAVLSTTEPKVKYICTVDDAKSPYGKIVDCEQSLRICEYTKVKYGMNNRGNYWLVNSNTRNGAVAEVVRYGIIPGA